MKVHTVPAVFMRGGTSKALVFHARDLPFERAARDRIFLSAMGSPDPCGRQLDGMGGGLSSLSKICIVAPSSRNDADVEYTFGQVAINEAKVDYNGNCGNILSAIGPFSVDEGLVSCKGETAIVRILNTNTDKIIHASFPVEQGRTRYHGDFHIPGVTGTGAAIRLDFVRPGGATTGKLLPTSNTKDKLQIEGDTFEVSMVDAANACVFVRAADLGLTGTELPEELERKPKILERLQEIRVEASIAMGIAKDVASARSISAVPSVGFVSGPADFHTLSGEQVVASDVDLTFRVISHGQPHRALPLTTSLCAAVAAGIEGTVVQESMSKSLLERGSLRVGMPSGILTVGSSVARTGDGWTATHGYFYRTARRLFDGRLYLPAQRCRGC
jgi:2-methylaconitate cis-trans-isomerase PrpF